MVSAFRPLACCLITITAPVLAAPLPVVNPGFEDTSGSVSLFNEFSFGALAGWEIYDNPGGLIGSGASNPFYVGTLRPTPDPASPGEFVFFTEGAPEGERVAIAYTRSGSGGLGEYGLQQTLVGTPLLPHRRYTLRVEVGNIASGVALSGEDFNLEGFPGYRVELLAGGQPIAADDSSLSGSIAEGAFVTSTVEFSTAGLGESFGLDLGVRLVNLNEVDATDPSADLEVDFDNVRLDVAPALDGDFNFDGLVNAADYTAWRETLGSETNLSADSNGDGVINEPDRAVWAAQYGAATAPAAVAYALPEPTAAAMAGLSGLLALGKGRRAGESAC